MTFDPKVFAKRELLLKAVLNDHIFRIERLPFRSGGYILRIALKKGTVLNYADEIEDKVDKAFFFLQNIETENGKTVLTFRPQVDW